MPRRGRGVGKDNPISPTFTNKTEIIIIHPINETLYPDVPIYDDACPRKIIGRTVTPIVTDGFRDFHWQSMVPWPLNRLFGEPDDPISAADTIYGVTEYAYNGTSSAMWGIMNTFAKPFADDAAAVLCTSCGIALTAISFLNDVNNAITYYAHAGPPKDIYYNDTQPPLLTPFDNLGCP